jgi:uracil-DNA glycosylase
VDYALSEVVHCKSESEIGVDAAQDECAERYLRPIVEASGAAVVVCLGDKAAKTVRRMFKVPERKRIYRISGVGQRDRYFAFLPHPNARSKRKSFQAILSQ